MAHLTRRRLFELGLGPLSIGLAGIATARVRAATTHKVPVNGLEFDVTVDGPRKGRPVILLHGFPQSALTWLPVSTALGRRGFRAIAPDLRGYSPGARPVDAAAYTFAHFRSDVLAIADALGAERFDLCGFGMGAALGWMIAASTPARVRSLTALRYPHPAAFANAVEEDPAQQQAWREIEKAMNQGAHQAIEARAALLLENDAARFRSFLRASGLPSDAADQYVARLQGPGALVAAMRWQQAAAPTEFARVPPVTVPTLFIWSEGPALTAATARATHRYVSGPYEERVLDGAGHFLLETAADRVIALLLKHLRTVRS